MKKYLVLLSWIAVCSLAPAAFAGGEGKPKAEKDKDSAKIVVGGAGIIKIGPDGRVEVSSPNGAVTKKEDGKKPASPGVKVETMRIGKVITVGPDGKMEVKDIGGELPKEVLDKLPKEIQDHLKKGRLPAGPGDCVAGGKMKIVVENNGQRQEYESDLGDDALKQLPQGLLDEVLKKAGDDLPPEAKEALKAATHAMKAGQKPLAPTKGQEDVAKKLDKILERLERLEGDVQALKAQAEKAHKK
jgi:hypothetical protein